MNNLTESINEVLKLAGVETLEEGFEELNGSNETIEDLGNTIVVKVSPERKVCNTVGYNGKQYQFDKKIVNGNVKLLYYKLQMINEDKFVGKERHIQMINVSVERLKMAICHVLASSKGTERNIDLAEQIVNQLNKKRG